MALVEQHRWNSVKHHVALPKQVGERHLRTAQALLIVTAPSSFSEYLTHTSLAV